jgi:hypothetical protein
LTKEKIETKIIQAKAYWCKVLGKPRPSYDGKSLEWTVDVLFDKDGLKSLQEFGVDRFYIKKGKPNKDNTPNELTGKPVVKFVRKSVKSDGTPANPIPLRDENGDPWDPTKLIGNGSVVNLKLMKFKVSLPGQPTRWKPYLLEMQVWDHVEYEGTGNGDGGFPKKGAKAQNPDDGWGFDDADDHPDDGKRNHQKDVDFDDEIPF